jgi:hypothetical protein
MANPNALPRFVSDSAAAAAGAGFGVILGLATRGLNILGVSRNITDLGGIVVIAAVSTSLATIQGLPLTPVGPSIASTAAIATSGIGYRIGVSGANASAKISERVRKFMKPAP